MEKGSGQYFKNDKLKFTFMTCSFLFLASIRNSQHWNTLGEGLDNRVGKMVYDSTKNILYAFGSFSTSTNSEDLNGCAQWDGVNWKSLGTGIDDIFQVTQAIIYQGDLYAGGDFRTIGGIVCNGIAKWNGIEWLPLGLGFSSGVQSFALLNNELFISVGPWLRPDFSGISGIGIFKWDGLVMQVVDTSAQFIFDQLIAFKDSLYSNSRERYDSIPRSAMREWTGSTWIKIGNDFNADTSVIWTSEVFNDHLYLAISHFDSLQSSISGTLSSWDGTTWVNISGSINGFINDLQPFKDKLYVGGLYDQVDNLSARSIAAWDGSQWTALVDEGIFGDVTCLSVGSELLFCGGIMGKAGKKAVKSITSYSLEDLPPTTNASDVYITVYPNPTVNKIVIDFSHATTIGTRDVKLYNSIGQIFPSKNKIVSYDKIEIDTSELSQGNYIIEIVDQKNNNYTSKLIKI